MCIVHLKEGKGVRRLQRQQWVAVVHAATPCIHLEGVPTFPLVIISYYEWKNEKEGNNV